MGQSRLNTHSLSVEHELADFYLHLGGACGQFLDLLIAQSGLDADEPSPRGAISRVVERVDDYSLTQVRQA